MREFFLLAVLAGAALLGACADTSMNSYNPFGASAASTPAPKAAAPQTAHAPPKLDPAPRAADLLGGDDTRIRAALGTPDFVRKEPGAEIWRYGGESCTLLVFLYTEETGMRASHIDARAPSGGVADREGCIASVNKALQLGARSA